MSNLRAIYPKSNPSNSEMPEMDDEEAQFFETLLKNYSAAWSAEHDQRKQCLDDIQFAHVEESQWDDVTRRLRKNRPKYEINKIAVAISQVLGDMRQSQISGKVRPSGGEATQKQAEMLQGLVRDIENDSAFEYIKNVAAKEAFTGGFGGWQVVTEYNDDDSFEQSIKIKPIHSATTSVFFDPSSKGESHQDANHCFVAQQISKDRFEELYGETTPKSSLDGYEDIASRDWQERDLITIADYWCKKPYTKTIVQMSNGEVKELDDDLKKVLDELAELGITVVSERKVKSHKVWHYKISGDRVLDGPNEWAGSTIPVVPVYGYEMWIDNQHYYRGMVRFAKDAQRIYNYTTSAKIEAAARAPQDPWIVTPRMLRGFEEKWRNFPNTNEFALPVNPDPMVPGGLPTRLGGPAVNNALIEQTNQADQDIKATTGWFSPSLGQNPNSQSGKALGIQREQGDRGTFEMMDNLAKAVRRTTEIIVELIPKIYDTQRSVRILQEDGEANIIELNKTIIDEESGEAVVIENDITVGRYDVIEDVGPSYRSKRTEAVDTLSFLLQTNPDMGKFVLDLLAKNMDFPYSSELEKRMRKIQLSEGIIDPNEEEQKQIAEQQNSPQAKLQQEMQNKMVELSMKYKEAETKLKALEAFEKEVAVAKDQNLLPLEVEQASADIDKTESETRKNEAQARKAVSDSYQQFSQTSVSSAKDS